MFLRYASGATTLLQLADDKWLPLETTRYRGSNAVEAEASSLGVFVAAAPKDLPYTLPTPWWSYAIVIILLLPPVVVLVWWLLRG